MYLENARRNVNAHFNERNEYNGHKSHNQNIEHNELNWHKEHDDQSLRNEYTEQNKVGIMKQ